MNFERGKDPKDTMNLGARREAIEIKMAGYNKEGHNVEITQVHDVIAFLRRLATMDIPCDSLFGPKSIFVKTEGNHYLQLDEIEGKFLKYRDQYYLVPTKDEIIELGFDHMLRNADVDRERRKNEEERNRRMSQALMSGPSVH